LIAACSSRRSPSGGNSWRCPQDLYLVRLIHHATRTAFPGERLWTAAQFFGLIRLASKGFGERFEKRTDVEAMQRLANRPEVNDPV
jgi:hypothetical protein